MVMELVANLIRFARYEMSPRSDFPECSARITFIEATAPGGRKG
jgi:hypothetical protein